MVRIHTLEVIWFMQFVARLIYRISGIQSLPSGRQDLIEGLHCLLESSLRLDKGIHRFDAVLHCNDVSLQGGDARDEQSFSSESLPIQSKINFCFHILLAQGRKMNLLFLLIVFNEFRLMGLFQHVPPEYRTI